MKKYITKCRAGETMIRKTPSYDHYDDITLCDSHLVRVHTFDLIASHGVIYCVQNTCAVNQVSQSKARASAAKMIIKYIIRAIASDQIR